jgi:hypothetical protein
MKSPNFTCPHCGVESYKTKAWFAKQRRKEKSMNVTKEERDQEQNKPVEILRDYIAGVGFSDYQKVLKQMKVGDSLSLTWERGNKYDPKAIRIDWKGTKLGYVSRKENSKVHQYREGGAKVTCELTAINEGNPSHTLLCVSIRVSTEKSSQSVTQGDQKISD